MRMKRISMIVTIFTVMALIPSLLIIRIVVGRDTSILMWVLKMIPTGLYFLLVYLAGYWGFVCYNLRYLFVILYVAATGWSVKNIFGLPFLLNSDFGEVLRHNGFSFTIYIIASIVLLYFIVKSIRAYTYKGTPVSLEFPLKEGKYYVLEGGDSSACRLINYHLAGSQHKGVKVQQSMQFATDIVKLNKFGSFVDGIFSKHIDKYRILHEDIFSPCDGVVVEVVDDLDNEVPFSGKHPDSVGNRVVILKDGVHIILGHMQKGSILVHKGDTVSSGQKIAVVGNSGLTEFPHLHIQATKAGDFSIWDGEGIPMLFDGVFLVKNRIISKS